MFDLAIAAGKTTSALMSLVDVTVSTMRPVREYRAGVRIQSAIAREGRQ